ncbi:MAG: M14 family metallopeptidase [Acidimicrobiales bacterium]
MTAELAPSYAVARQRLLSVAERAGARLQSFGHPGQRGPDGGELAIDVVELGDPDAGAALLIVSGTHGVEGFAGSALQTGFLEGGRAGALPAGVRLVMVHAFNPFGFAWSRRTNEDNVDLNRNFIDWSAAPAENPGYDDLAELLVPETWDEESKAASTLALLEVAERIGVEEMGRIITGGQYRHPGGVFYGGTGPVWSHRWLLDNAPSLLGSASRLGIVDLHTGLGPWGTGELIVHERRSEPGFGRAQRWWGDVRSMQDGESVSAELTGDWLSMIARLVPDTEVTGAALEFGTIDPIEVLQALRAEAWCHRAGDPRSALADRVRADVRSAFADDGPSWLAALTERFDAVVAAALTNLSRDSE